MNVPKEVHGLLVAAQMALSELQKKFPAPLHGTSEDMARVELATALNSIEMVKYYVIQIEQRSK